MREGKRFSRIAAVDFDGTLAITNFPEILGPVEENLRYCKRLKARGEILILWTCRKGKDLEEAVKWCRNQGLEFDYVNENTPENMARFGEPDTRKIYADEYIDDKARNLARERLCIRCIRKALLNQGKTIAISALAGALAVIIMRIIILYSFMF